MLVEGVINTDTREKLSSLLHSLSIDAPMDGMFYLRPSSNDPAFITIGDEISPG